MPPRNATVRLQSKKYLLTYAQCPLTKEEILESLQGRFSLKAYTIAQELHQDGERHLHAAILLQDSPSTTDMRVFDVNSYHPNIKTLKTTSDYKRASESARRTATLSRQIRSHLLRERKCLTSSLRTQVDSRVSLCYHTLELWLSTSTQFGSGWLMFSRDRSRSPLESALRRSTCGVTVPLTPTSQLGLMLIFSATTALKRSPEITITRVSNKILTYFSVMSSEVICLCRNSIGSATATVNLTPKVLDCHFQPDRCYCIQLLH